MKIDAGRQNAGFKSLIIDPHQLIALDTNFLLPPDKRKIGANKNYTIDEYEKIWLEPLFSTFSQLAIHEAVDIEILSEMGVQRNYIDRKKKPPYCLQVLRDNALSPREAAMRNSIEAKISPNTKYSVKLDNADDRGEVKTLAHIAVKQYLYFASNDTNALRLVEWAEELETGLDHIHPIHYYEVIYYFYKENIADKAELRNLYRYMYRLTSRDKKENPGWNEFLEKMDKLYAKFF